MTPEQIAKKRKKFRDQCRALCEEVDYALIRAGDLCDGNPNVDVKDEIPKTIKRITYRVKRIKKLWKECSR